MSTRLLAFIWAISALSSAAQPLLRARNSPAVQSAEAARAAFDPWLRAVEGVLHKTKDAEVDFYLQVLRNPALMVPTGEAGPMCLRNGCLSLRPTPLAHGSA